MAEMDMRKKLVELLSSVSCNGNGESLGSCPDRKYGLCGEMANLSYCVIQNAANHLIAHGVTVQELGECDYCKQFDDPWDAPMIAKEDYEPDRGIYLYNGFLCANGGEFVDAKVNFCPMCGRRLPQPPKGE